MRSSDDNRPPDGPADGAGAGNETPDAYLGEGYVEPPLSVEDAEARLRDFAALSDSEASFAGPEDELRRSPGRDSRRARGDEHRSEPRDEHYYGDYTRPRSSVWRWIVRIAVPIVFLAGVIAIVMVVLNSGILGGDTAASPSPSASPSKGTVVTVTIYKVKKGDTLSQIAVRFGVSVDRILEANPTIDINSLTVGTKLKIPPPQQ
jgi:LysM repeat protein